MTTQEELPIWVSTAPTDICLGLYWDGCSDEKHAGFPDDHEDICWSEGKDGHGDDNVHYVRADIANQCISTLKAENDRLRASAAPQEPVAGFRPLDHAAWCKTLIAALKKLSFAAQTTGGTAGPDAGLQEAIAEAEHAMSFGGGFLDACASPQPQVAPQEPVAFYGPDKDDPTKGASLPMIPDSWRFRIREQGGAIFIEAQDNGPWIPYAAVEPYLLIPRVKRATGRVIPDLTGIEHVCKYQATIRAKDAAPQPQAPSATSDDVRDKRIAEWKSSYDAKCVENTANFLRAEKAEAALADARDALRWYYHRNCADSLMGFDDFVAAAAKEGRALRTTSEK